MQSILGALLTAGYAAAMTTAIAVRTQLLEDHEYDPGSLQQSFGGAENIAKQFPQYANQITAAAKSSFLDGANWAYTAGIIAVLVGATLVFFMFPKKAEEEALLRQYHDTDVVADFGVATCVGCARAGAPVPGRAGGRDRVRCSRGRVRARCRYDRRLAAVPRPSSTSRCRADSTRCARAAPGACRCSRRGRIGSRTWRYRAAGVTVDLDGADAPDGRQRTADPRLPRRPGRVEGRAARDARRYRTASSVDRRSTAPAFPFPHRIEITAIVRDPELRITTRRSFRPDPGRCRSRSVGIPTSACRTGPGAGGGCGSRRVATSPSTDRGIPTGEVVAEAAEREPIGRRTFDDGYALGSRRSARDRKRRSGSPSSCDAARDTRSRRCGSRAASRSPRSSPWRPRPTRSSIARRPSSAAATRTPRPSP